LGLRRRDARHGRARPARPDFLRPIVETHLANTVLTNGARLYVDHAHPEYSSPECRTPLEATLYDVAGEEVMRRALMVANEMIEPHQAISLYKNNSDSKGNSYGTHENYLVSRNVEFNHIVRAMVPHFVSRQIIIGAARWAPRPRPASTATPSPTQLARRVLRRGRGTRDDAETSDHQHRDEPHADAERFRRLHVIIGDANMSQVATFVKLGSTALLPRPWRTPVSVPFRRCRDNRRRRAGLRPRPGLKYAVLCEDDRERTAWDFQDELWHLANDHVERKGAEAVAGPDEVQLVLTQWREMLDGVRDDLDAVADRIDWVAKLRILRGFQERHSLAPGRATSRHRPAVSRHSPRTVLAQRVGLRALHADYEVREAVHNPPEETRAYFRGQCVARYPNEIVAANWDSVVFDLGEGPLQRVPMLDPLRGTRVLTEELLEQVRRHKRFSKH